MRPRWAPSSRRAISSITASSIGAGGRALDRCRAPGVPRHARGQVGQDRGRGTGRNHHDPMVGVAAGERHPRLELDVVRERRVAGVEAASGAVGPGVLDGRDPGAEEVGAERDDDLGPVEVIARHRPQTVGLLVGVGDRRQRNRVVGHQPAVGEVAEEGLDRRPLRRTGGRVGEEADPSAAGGDPFEGGGESAVDRRSSRSRRRPWSGERRRWES